MIFVMILGIILSIVHYLSESILLKSYESKNYASLVSFSAGISVTYIFLDLFPNFSDGAAQLNKLLFLSVLLGFVIFHLVEKYIYQHSSEDKVWRQLALEDSVISFVYHFVVGILIVSFAKQGIFEGILFFVPILFYTAISTLPVDFSESKLVKLIVASSTTLGVLFALFAYPNLNPLEFFAMLGFVIGTLIFTVMRHSIPTGKHGKPIYFVVGVLLYTLILFLFLYN